MQQLLEYRNAFLRDYDVIKHWSQVERPLLMDRVLIDPVGKQLIEVYKETKYVRYTEMISTIKSLISQLDKTQEYYLLFPLNFPFKIGSENAIILECFDELSQLNIVDLVTSQESRISGTSRHLLIIDDAVYTGRNLKYVIESMCDKIREYTVISFTSSRVAESYFQSQKVNFITSCYPSLLIDVSVEVLRKKHPGIETSLIEAHLIKAMGDVEYMPLIYFDHKIHDGLITLYTEDLFRPCAYPTRLPAEYVQVIHQRLTPK